MTIAGLGAVLAPAERLRSIYPRYFETEATAGPDGLAVLPFRAGTPYEGEDLIYFADKPEAVFRPLHADGPHRPGHLRARAPRSMRPTSRCGFPAQWLQDWRSVAAGFDRLVAQLHPQGG